MTVCTPTLPHCTHQTHIHTCVRTPSYSAAPHICLKGHFSVPFYHHPPLSGHLSLRALTGRSGRQGGVWFRPLPCLHSGATVTPSGAVVNCLSHCSLPGICPGLAGGVNLRALSPNTFLLVQKRSGLSIPGLALPPSFLEVQRLGCCLVPPGSSALDTDSFGRGRSGW